MNQDDGSRKPPAAAPKDERRETQERLAEAMGGSEGRNARKALKEDPSLPDPDQAGGKRQPGRR